MEKSESWDTEMQNVDIKFDVISKFIFFWIFHHTNLTPLESQITQFDVMLCVVAETNVNIHALAWTPVLGVQNVWVWPP